MTEHDRRILAPKMNTVDDVAFVHEWSARHLFCQACGNDFRPLQTHHLIGGRGGRSDEATNLLRACGHPCHLLCEGLDVPDDRPRIVSSGWTPDTMPRLLPKITLAVALTMKRFADPEEYCPMRLTVLHGRRLPELAAIPDWFVQQWRVNRPELLRGAT